jgi:hypothetical protein
MWRCPRCGSSIRIFDARTTIVVHEDGTQQDAGFEWDDQAEAECVDCTWKGTAGAAYREHVA